MTLVGKDPICNAAMSRLPLVSPPCTHKTRSYQRIEPSGEASGRWEPSSPRTKERSQKRAQQCVQWTKHARGQPGSLASGRGRVHRGSWTPGGTWEAALNVLEVLGSSQPRTTRKCSASLSREKPASWGRSEGRQGGRLSSIFPTSRLAPARCIPGCLLHHFTQTSLSKGAKQTPHPCQCKVTPLFPACGEQARRHREEADGGRTMPPSVGRDPARVSLSSNIIVVPKLPVCEAGRVTDSPSQGCWEEMVTGST